MPAVGFTKPKCPGEQLSFDEAPAYYEEHTETPAEAIALIAGHEGDPRRRGPNLSPSGAYEKNTCVRQLAIKKFVPYLIDGVSGWAATEGTAWHAAFESVTPEAEDEYHREVLIPNFFLKKEGHLCLDGYGHASTDADVACQYGNDIRLFEYTPEHSSWEVQLFDGIWMNGKVDKLHRDMHRIEDFKTKAWGGWKDRKTGQHKIKHYPPRDDAKLQLNLYRRMVEVITGTNPTELYIRQMYRGSRIANQTWKKFEIEVMSNDELEFKVRPFVERAVGAFTELKQIEEAELAKGNDPVPAILHRINDLPLDGEDKHMFNGHKCPEWCTQMPICFELAGKVRFETKPEETRCLLNLEGLK